MLFLCSIEVALVGTYNNATLNLECSSLLMQLPVFLGQLDLVEAVLLDATSLLQLPQQDGALLTRAYTHDQVSAYCVDHVAVFHVVHGLKARLAGCAAEEAYSLVR